MELLLVVVSLLLITALLTPAVTDAKLLGMKEQCAANLKKSETAMKMYAGDFDGLIPVYQKFPDIASSKDPAVKCNLYTWMGALYQTKYLEQGDPAARCPQMGGKMVIDTRSKFYKYSSYGTLTSNKPFHPSSRCNQIRVTGKKSEYRFVVTTKLAAPEAFPLLVDTLDKSKREYWAFSTEAKDSYGMHARHENRVQSAFADGSVRALSPEEFQTHCQKSGLFSAPGREYGYFNMSGEKVTLK